VKVAKLLHDLNLPRIICDHTLGKHHSDMHRFAVGCFIMVVGGIISRQFEHTMYVSHLMNVFGEGVRGMGLVPFLELLQKKFQ
jgi:hypothetical protein